MTQQHPQRLAAEARRFRAVAFTEDFSCTIGRSPSAEVRYEAPEVSGGHAQLTLRGDVLTIEDLGSTNGTLVNGRTLAARTPCRLHVGDVVRIADLTCMVARRYVVANCAQSVPLEASIPGACTIDHERVRAAAEPVEPAGDERLFYPAPRLMHSVHKRAFAVDGPPPGGKRDESPAIMQLGPSFVMGLASVFMVANTVSRLVKGADVVSTLPMLAMSVSMIAGMLVWPLVSKRYERRRAARDEARRESTYTDYLNAIEHTLQQECAAQGRVLAENRVTVPALLERARALSPELMNRTSVHGDFMDLRVGAGSLPLEADIRWPAEQFAVDRDRLMAKVIEVSHRPPRLEGVPLAFNPAEHYVAGVVGPREQAWAFVRGLVVQLCALMSYQDVKLMLVANAEEQAAWGCMRTLPHLFDDAGQQRFLATSSEELMGLTMRLERELERREALRAEREADFGCRYVVLCAHKALTDPSETLGRLARLRSYRGISLVFMGSELKDLPRECAYVIDLAGTVAAGAVAAGGGPCMFDRADVSGTMLPFAQDIAVTPAQMETFARCMGRVHLDTPGQRTALPASLGFLEMFRAGNVGQLDIAARWAAADASRTLQVPVGVDAQGEPAMLNLHEKVHGPHGLIAGTTGSGKSEFIITYVLSLAVCYPPDQVAFVLIDYKGGGLAGAFDNDRFRLPHVAGTITNLDGAAISRSLVSIKSELKRRQAVLAQAREVTGEATMDIYKYISYYRRGVLADPLPHLFLIADEFAELKDQQPEFMDELMSAARIGRSLGVHLILATQKPSGVVNDQIRSNMRLKVCLKVAEAGDSKEMIGRADAADIKGPGRYYMLVGYNEYFAAGQAAYAGAPYAPSIAFEPKRDDAVELIDNRGESVATRRNPRPALENADMPEVNAVLGEVEHVAGESSLAAAPLWLDPMASNTDLDALASRYEISQGEGVLSLLGEIDMPEQQNRELYAIDWSRTGNFMVYGASGVGTDEVVATALFSLASCYGADTCRFYVIDCEPGVLSALSPLPQCGGVVRSDDPERMENLFKLIEDELLRRREMISSDGVSALEGEPHIICALANISAFYELFPAYEDRLGALARDGARCGIHMVLTAVTATAPRMRLRSCFPECIVLSCNDPGDYTTVFGSKPPVIPERVPRRGVARWGKALCEFQGAALCPEEMTVSEAVAGLAERLIGQMSVRAPRIPVLPRYVHAEDMYGEDRSKLDVPVGYSKDAVGPVWFPLARSSCMLVLGDDRESLDAYTRELGAHITQTYGMDTCILDPDASLGATDDINVYQEADELAGAVDELVDEAASVPKMVLCTSVVHLMAALDAEHARKLQAYIENERFAGRTGFIVASEMWRVRALYDKWFKVLCAQGSGVWVGNGFADQSIIKPAQMKPAYRLPMRKDEGYRVLFGTCDTVRLLTSAKEGA